MREMKSVLVVDDDPVVVNLCAETLRDAGYRVESVVDGRKFPMATRDTRPDLILLDVVMPLVDTYDALAQLRQDHPTHGVPVILVTADSQTNQELERWRQLGVVDCVAKPFDLDDLLSSVSRAIESSSNESGDWATRQVVPVVSERQAHQQSSAPRV